MGAYGEGHPGVFLVTELGGGGGYDRGRVFKLSEPEQLDRIVADRLARQRPYIPEPGFARMAKLWAQITGALPDDAGTGAGLDDAGGPALGLDLAEDADETAAVTAKIAAARELAAQDTDVPDVDPEVWQRVVAERRRQFDAAYTDVNLPEADQAAILAMLAAPGGVSTRAAAAGLSWSHTTVHQQLQRWRLEGVAEMRGTGSARRWHLTGRAAGSQHPAAYPPLHAVPDAPAGQAGGDSS